MVYEVQTARLRRAFTKTKARQYALTDHAMRRMEERDISEQELRDGIGNHGRVIEIQNHGWDTKMVVQGCRSNGEPFYALITDTIPCQVVTVCNFDEDVWEQCGGGMRRK